MTKINVVVCLLLSALVLAKANDEYGNDVGEYDYQTVDDMGIPLTAIDQVESNETLFKPNKRLQVAEAKLTEAERELVERGEVRETLEDAVDKELKNPEIAERRREAIELWKAALSGPETARVVGAIGKAARRVMTSPVGSQSVGLLSTLVRLLLETLGEINERHAVAGTMDAAIKVLTSARLPKLIEEGGEAVIKMASNPQVAKWENAVFQETKKLLSEPNIVTRLDNYLGNLESMMSAQINANSNAMRANRLH